MTSPARTVVETCREAVKIMREPAQSYRVDAGVVHGPALGDHPQKREELGNMCKAIASVQRCSVSSVHGALRRDYGVNSVYRISVLYWEIVRRDLQRAICGDQPLLSRTRPRSALPPSTRQVALFN
jgi:hypothetical protein